MNIKAAIRLGVITAAVLAGFSLQAVLVKAGYQDFIIGFALGAVAYQTAYEPSWIKEIREPDHVVSIMIWVLFPFVALLGCVSREILDTLLAE